MSDTLPTVWPADAHTFAKHAILKRYLDAWFPILTRQAATFQGKLGARTQREILYIDGFAGPGIYSSGEPGSPVIALKAALEHPVEFPSPVRMIFVEQRADRFNHLTGVLAPYLQKAKNSRKRIQADDPLQGECDVVLNGLLDSCEKRGVGFGPALAFFDQFGYSSVPMDLIGRVLRYGQCEVFTYLDYKDMNRWITDVTKAPAFTRAYGGEEWRECIDLPEARRRTGLLDRYKVALRDERRGGAKYVTSFLMFDRNEQPLYWLIFCTNNIRGLEEMKKAMWSVDRSGNFRFSDRDNPDQLKLLDESCSPSWLAEELDARLTGREMTVAEVKEFVLTDTPCYLFRDALKMLESEEPGRLRCINAPKGRRRGDYKEEDLDEIVLRFGTTGLY